MKVYIEKTKEKKEINSKTVAELLEKLGINPTTVIAVVNGEAATEDAELSAEDEITIMSVVSGG
ncbi:MAG: MoaD/ThiS family protein [archaeon]